MHRLYDEASVSDSATRYGREQRLTVVDGGCPLMVDLTADPGRKLLRFLATRTGCTGASDAR